MNSEPKLNSPLGKTLGDYVKAAAQNSPPATLPTITSSPAPLVDGVMEITVNVSVSTVTGVRLLTEMCQLLQKSSVSKLSISGHATAPENSPAGESSMARSSGESGRNEP